MSSALKNRSFFKLIIALVASAFQSDKGSAFLAVGTAPKLDDNPSSKKSLLVNVEGDPQALIVALVEGMKANKDFKQILFKSVEQVKLDTIDEKCAESFGKATNGARSIQEIAEDVKASFNAEKDVVVFIGVKDGCAGVVVQGEKHDTVQVIINAMEKAKSLDDVVHAAVSVTKAMSLAKYGDVGKAISSILDSCLERVAEKRSKKESV